LHGVRQTYATVSQDARHNVKTLSERIGHADVSVTAKIYTHKSRAQIEPSNCT
jgi:integrase